MDTEAKKNKKKPIIIGTVAALVVIVAVVVGIFVLGGEEEGYRTIQIYEMNGQGTLTRKGMEEMDAYENLMLKSEDKLMTKADSTIRLKMDGDKFMLLEPDTEIELFAVGDEKNSKTNISLVSGAVTVEIKDKLKKGSTYRITTPNSVMAVRGTVFRVEVKYDENGKCITQVTVLEGSVSVEKKDESGNLSDEVFVDAGKQAIIKEEAGSLKIILEEEIDLTKLPVETLEFLKDIIEGGRELCFSLEELEKILEALLNEADIPQPEQSREPYECTVTFKYDGKVFGTQKVTEGQCVQKPALLPDADGDWDYNFDEPIVTNTAIEFR